MDAAPKHRSICDCPLIAAVAALVMAATVHAAPSTPPAPPNVLLCRDGDRLAMLPADVDEANFSNLPPVMFLERSGGRSAVSIRRGDASLTITASLDTTPPGWIHVWLRADDCGVTLTTQDTDCNFRTFEQADSVDLLSADGRMIFGAILAHLGQAGLPDLAVIRAIACDESTSQGDKLLADSILARLDADAFTVRQAASRELAASPQAIRWFLTHRLLDVSPEAQTRVNAALALYADAGKWKGMLRP